MQVWVCHEKVFEFDAKDAHGVVFQREIAVKSYVRRDIVRLLRESVGRPEVRWGRLRWAGKWGAEQCLAGMRGGEAALCDEEGSLPLAGCSTHKPATCRRLR